MTSSLIYMWVIFLAYLTPIGHAYTKVGRTMWSIVIRKYWVFLKVCCGFWTDDALECYQLRRVHMLEIDEYIDLSLYDGDKKVSEQPLEVEPVDLSEDDLQASTAPLISGDTTMQKQFSILTSATEKDDDCINLDNYEATNEQEKLDLEMHECVQVVSGTRAIIIQMIPFLTLLSIFAVGLSHVPIYCSQKASNYFPPFLITDAYSRGILLEKQETNHELSVHKRGQIWVVWLKAMVIFVKDSRLVQAVFGYIQFIIKAGVIFSEDAFPWIFASIIIFFPFMVILLMEIYIHTGRAIGIVDEDLDYVYKFFKIKIEPRDLNDLENDEFAEEFMMEMSKSNKILSNDVNENEKIVGELITENEMLKKEVRDFYCQKYSD